MSEQITLYEAVGGMPFFRAVAKHFYESVKADPVLLDLYPDQNDLDAAEERLMLFLVQYWGGPQEYMARRGHPRLRMRHNPYVIGPEARDHWLAAMTRAVDAQDPDPEVRAMLMDYFVMAAEAMRNSD